MKNCKFFVIYCLILNFSYSHSDMKKSWAQSSKNQLAPNLEPDRPKFTPFNNDGQLDAVNNNYSEKLNKVKDKVIGNSEPFLINKDDESFIDKLIPFSDYIYDMYDHFKSSKIKKHKKLHSTHNKNNEAAEKLQDQDIEITTEMVDEAAITTEKLQQVDYNGVDGSVTTIVDRDQGDELSEVIATDDNDIVVDQFNESTENVWNNKKNKKFLRYTVGPGVNVTLDVPNEVVRVKLDENCLKDVFSGRGKKKTLITKTLALFILPFLIQSSFVPFLLTTIKMMLMKSLVVGKIAILLFLIALFKNHKLNQLNDPMPYYLDTSQSHGLLHHRRSENNENKGYEVYGKPETYVT